jgi:hypothetical protein
LEARLLLIADFANVDSLGKLNIIGAFNHIYAPQFPVQHPAMYLVVRIGAELGEFNQEKNLTFILFDEDGNEKWRTPELKFAVPSPLGGKTGEFNAVVGIQQMMFEHPGRYEFRVYINGDQKGIIPLDIELGSGQPQA